MKNMHSKRILLADNSAEFRRSVIAFLEWEGYAVVEAGSPKEALAKLEQARFDLVLADLRMQDDGDSSDMSGLEIAKFASENGIPCIIVTAFPTVGLARIALRSRGAEPFAKDLITKASGAQALLDSISLTLRNREQPSGNGGPDELKINLEQRLVRKNGVIIKLSKNQYTLLEELDKKDGGVCTYAELIKSIYAETLSDKEAGNDKRLRNLVDRTKEKIEHKHSSHEYIETILGRGLRLNLSYVGAYPSGGTLSNDRMEVPRSASDASLEDDIHFTAFHPKEGNVETWLTLLVYVHAEATLQKVSEDAKHFTEKMKYAKQISAPAQSRLRRGTEITIVPNCEGITFNPNRLSLKWLEDFHRLEFRFRADASLKGDAAKGQISFYVGPLIMGTLKFAMLFDIDKEDLFTEHEEHGQMYHQDKIFISYSHKDTNIVSAFKKVHEATGYDVLIDIDDLRSGEQWSPALMDMIDRADIFQLFWSQNSCQSKYCQQEWHHALKRNMDGFIRPVYWQLPLPAPPEELQKYHFEYVEL